MLMPKKVKYRKKQRGRRRGRAKGGDYIAFGDHALQALETGWVSARQIEAARIAIARGVKRGGKIWIRIFPDKPITKKPLETRMGKGKGSPEAWVAVVRTPRAAGRRGKLIVALGGTMEEAANAAAGQWEAVWQAYGTTN